MGDGMGASCGSVEVRVGMSRDPKLVSLIGASALTGESLPVFIAVVGSKVRGYLAAFRAFLRTVFMVGT
jgi:hypothetical protein